MQVRSLGREDPLEESMATTPVFLPGESHGQRSLVGHSPRGHKESDMTERLSAHRHKHTHTPLHIYLLRKCLFRCSAHFGGRKQWHPTPVLLPGKSHGRRSLVGCSPWGHEESDTTERLHFQFLLSCTGEGNGTHSSVPAWRIPGTGEPGGLPSLGSHRVGHA